MINIRVRVRNLVRKHGTRNPEIIAAELGIFIQRKPFKKILGFYKKTLYEKSITVNSNLPESLQLLIIAHELGHALLHDSRLDEYIHQYSRVPRGKAEIEANKFAAELLIDEKEIDKLYLQDMSIDQLSSYFGVPGELIEYKLFNKELQGNKKSTCPSKIFKVQDRLTNHTEFHIS